MFGDHVGLHHAYAALFSLAQVLGGKQYEELLYVDRLENPVDFPNILRWLVKHGFSDEDIVKIMGGSALRVLKQVGVH
jgi:membrane dipeptidase